MFFSDLEKDLSTSAQDSTIPNTVPNTAVFAESGSTPRESQNGKVYINFCNLLINMDIFNHFLLNILNIMMSGLIPDFCVKK